MTRENHGTPPPPSSAQGCADDAGAGTRAGEGVIDNRLLQPRGGEVRRAGFSRRRKTRGKREEGRDGGGGRGGAGTGQSAPRRRSGVSGGVGTLGARRRRYGGAPLPRWPRPQPPPSPCGAPARLTSALRAGPWARLSEPGTPAPVPPAGRGLRGSAGACLAVLELLGRQRPRLAPSASR